MKLINKGYSGVTVLGMDRVLWLFVSLIIGIMIPLIAFAYYSDVDTATFNTSITTMSCIELESIIVGTWEGDTHAIEHAWDQISAIHNLRCK